MSYDAAIRRHAARSGAFLKLARLAAARFAEWRKVRKTRRALGRLSEEQLKDIGLSRMAGDYQPVPRDWRRPIM